MGTTEQSDKIVASEIASPTTSKKIHPEDIAVGDFVGILAESYQYASFLWCGVDTFRLEPEKPVSVTYFPSGSIDVFEVKSVCLPFVSCRSVSGYHRVIDVRQTQLARLTSEFAESVREASNTSENKKKKKGKRKKKKRKSKN